MPTRQFVGHDLGAEALDDADLARLDCVEAAEDPERSGGDERGPDECMAAVPKPRETGGRFDVAESVLEAMPPMLYRCPIGEATQPGALSLRPFDLEQPDRVHDHEERCDLVNDRCPDRPK